MSRPATLLERAGSFNADNLAPARIIASDTAKSPSAMATLGALVLTRYRLPRLQVKPHLFRNSRAKDANIRAALLDRFGGREVAIGRKAAPGPLDGVHGDLWASVALAIIWGGCQRAQGAVRRLQHERAHLRGVQARLSAVKPLGAIPCRRCPRRPHPCPSHSLVLEIQWRTT